MEIRRWAVVGGLVIVLAVVLACLLFGASGFGLPKLSEPMGRAILGLRVNRVLTALVVGAALASAGCVFQALLRNPLAEPYILGVSSGAALGAGGAILLCSACSLLSVLVPAAAFVGAGLAMVIVLLVAGGVGSSVYSLILSGVIVSSVGASVLMFMVSTASSEGLHSVVWWMLGNLQPSSPVLLLVCAGVMLLGIAGVWWYAPDLDILTLGRDTAHHMGVNTRWVVLVCMVLATLMTSAAVAVAGLISFVGLIVPHAVRGLVGADHRRLIPLSALCGGLFLAVCDAVARSLLPLAVGRPIEIPVGVLTALCGGPFFIVILKLRGSRGWIG